MRSVPISYGNILQVARTQSPNSNRQDRNLGDNLSSFPLADRNGLFGERFPTRFIPRSLTAKRLEPSKQRMNSLARDKIAISCRRSILDWIYLYRPAFFCRAVMASFSGIACVILGFPRNVSSYRCTVSSCYNYYAMHCRLIRGSDFL